MTSTHWCHRLVTSLLGLLLAQSMAAWARNPDPVDKKQVIEAIHFEGVKALNEEKNAEAIRSKLGTTVNAVFDEDTVNFDAHIIEQSLQDQGYVYAKIQKVRSQPVETGRLIVVFVIDAGDLYHIAEVKLTGNQTFNSRQIAPKTHATVGMIYSKSSLLEDEKMINDFYGARGYADALVDIRHLEIGEGSLRVQYEISEGKKALFQAIQISGNAKVKEEVIRKEFKLATGDVFNTVLIQQGRLALLKTGLFEMVNVRSTPAAKPGFRNLEVTVLEK